MGCEPASNVGDESKLHQFTHVTIMKVAAIVVVVPHCCTATKPRSIQANAFHMWSGRIRRETWVSSRPRARHVPPLNTFLAAAIAINWIDICDKYWREKALDYLHVLLLISLPLVRSNCWRSLSRPMFKKGETAISISGASAVSWKHNCDEMPSSTEQSESDHLSHHICNNRFHPRPKN